MGRLSNRRPPEAEALLACLDDTPPGALTACSRWTANDLAAHLAGAYEEVIRHLRALADGRPLARTRGFEEREAPFRELAWPELLARVARGDEEVRAELGAILEADPDATLAWTGRQMRVDAFWTHLRSECALHRWDLVGDDEASWHLLGDPGLLRHAVTAIGAGPMTARGVAAGAAGGAPTTLRLRSKGHPDLVVTTGGSVSLGLVPPQGEATMTADQAARLLLVWGRTPQPATRITVTGRPEDALRARALLAGY